MPRVKVLNTQVDNMTMEEALDAICDLVDKRTAAYVVTPNLDHIVKLEEDTEFRAVYASADLVLADGKPLLWIAKWRRTPLKEKVSGSDLLPALARRAADKEYAIYLLGAAEGVAKRAATVLTEQNPGLRIVGTCSPEVGFEENPEQIEAIINAIRQAEPDILILALGSPKQEKFIYRYRELLNVPVSLGLGASLDFIAGNIKRAPRWMSDCGLEWLYRTIQEPRRLAKRYLADALQIIPLLWKYRK